MGCLILGGRDYIARLSMVCGRYIIIERYLGIRKTNIEPGSTLSLKEITSHEYYSNYIHPLHMGAQVTKDQFRFIANIPQCFFWK